MNQSLGQQGEAAVVDFLKHEGDTILAQNYRKFFGEIDIIAQQGAVVCFVEVKARKRNLVSMHELVTRSKQRKIVLVAKEFVSRQAFAPQEYVYRFDVALVQVEEKDHHVTYIPNAFTMDDF